MSKNLQRSTLKWDTHVYTGRLVGGHGVGDHRVTEGFFQNVLHVLANGRLTGREFDEHVKRMNVGDRAREMKVVFHARHGCVVQQFKRR